MINYILSDLRAGWAIVTISDGNRAVTVSASSTPTDALRDFLDAVHSLLTANTAECCWFQEPGELHWKLRRSEKSLEIEILRFDNAPFPGRHTGSGTPVFLGKTEWLNFAKQVHSALASLRSSLGAQGYERAWNYPFPTEAFDKLGHAIRTEARQHREPLA